MEEEEAVCVVFLSSLQLMEALLDQTGPLLGIALSSSSILPQRGVLHFISALSNLYAPPPPPPPPSATTLFVEGDSRPAQSCDFSSASPLPLVPPYCPENSFYHRTTGPPENNGPTSPSATPPHKCVDANN